MANKHFVEELEGLMAEQGLEGLWEGSSNGMPLARPRRQERFAMFNRYRGLKLS